MWTGLLFLRAICQPCKTTSEAMVPIEGANLVARTWNCCHCQLDVSLALWCDIGPLWLLFPVLTTSSVFFSYLNPPPTPSTSPHLPSHLPPCYAGPQLMFTQKNCQKALKFSHQLFITLFIYKTIDNQVLLCLTNMATTKLRAGSCKLTF